MSMTIIATLTCVYSWYRVLPNHLRHLGASEAQVGLAFMILAQAHRIPQILGGLLADRVGRKRTLVTATFLMAPMYALTGLMSTWSGVLLALGACWLCGAILGPSLTTIVADSVPEEKRGRAIGMLDTCAMAAVCVGPWVGGRILEAIGDFRTTMTILLLLTAGVYIVVATLRGIFLVETHSCRDRFTLQEARLNSLWLLGILGILICATAFLSTDGPFFALYAQDVIHLGESRINDAAFLGGLAGLLAAIIGGRLVDRIGTQRVLVVSFVSLSLLLLPFAWAWATRRTLLPGTGYALYVALFAPAEVFSIAYQKLLTSSAPRKHRALHVGLIGTVTGVFAAVANLAGGALYQGQGPAAPFALGALCATTGTVMAIVLWRKTRGDGRVLQQA